MNEFQLTLTNITAKHGMSVPELAKCLGYDPLLFENILTGKSRRVPVDFFIRIADVLHLDTAEKDVLIRSWAFGIERWNWPRSYESSRSGRAKSRAV